MTENDSDIVFYAFRYCLGRMSYCVNDFCTWAAGRIRDISEHTLRSMQNEILLARDKDDEALRSSHRGDSDTSWMQLGMECDRREWLNLEQKIETELNRRKHEQKA